jgi:hypothetical protein
MRDISIHRVILKKVLFFPPGIFHRYLRHDILLRTIDHADKAQLERVCPASEDIERVGTSVHKVELGQHAQCAQSAGVDRSC